MPKTITTVWHESRNRSSLYQGNVGNQQRSLQWGSFQLLQLQIPPPAMYSTKPLEYEQREEMSASTSRVVSNKVLEPPVTPKYRYNQIDNGFNSNNLTIEIVRSTCPQRRPLMSLHTAIFYISKSDNATILGIMFESSRPFTAYPNHVYAL